MFYLWRRLVVLAWLVGSSKSTGPSIGIRASSMPWFRKTASTSVQGIGFGAGNRITTAPR